MSDTVTKAVVFPITGDKYTVEIVAEDEAYQLLGVDEAYRDAQLTFRDPSESGSNESWFELSWSLERVNDNETKIEDGGVVSVYCPECGESLELDFDEDEFEHLGVCPSCGDAEFIRDQPIESGQSHVINYRVVFG